VTALTYPTATKLDKEPTVSLAVARVAYRIPSPNPSPEDLVYISERLAFVKSLIPALKPRQQFVMRGLLAGLSLPEIAERLGINNHLCYHAKWQAAEIIRDAYRRRVWNAWCELDKFHDILRAEWGR